MITYKESISIIEANCYQLKAETVHLNQAFGKILMEDLIADRDFPPFDRVMMDGIALSWNDWQSGIRLYTKESEQFAGQAQIERIGEFTCVETATGAMLPKGCDIVIPYEWLIQKGEQFRVSEQKPVTQWMNIHRQGNDRQKGALLAKAGSRIDMPLMTSLASVGQSEVDVAAIPKIAVVSTGDELVPVDQTPLSHQIRRSNDVTVRVLLEGIPVDIHQEHLIDEAATISNWLEGALYEHDALIFSGGVSMGKRDLLPKLLQEHGVTQLFHKVKQRPGKPLWFGRNDKVTVFGLPGNPVSTAMNAALYVRDIYLKNIHQPSNQKVALEAPIEFTPSMTFFCPVKVDNKEGRLTAASLKTKGSGDYAGLIGTNGFVVLADTESTFEKGSIQTYIPWKRS